MTATQSIATHAQPAGATGLKRTELMRRNSIWAKGPELGALYQLKGAINRQVNRLVKTKTTQQAIA